MIPGASPADEPIALIQKIAGGDKAAFSRFYDRFSSLVFSFAIRILRYPADAEETVQEVFMQVWRQASTYRKNRGNPEAWLITMTRSRAIDKLRSRRRKSSKNVPLEDLTGGDIARTEDRGSLKGAAANMGEKLMLQGVLQTLPEPMKEVLELSYFDGMTHEEIAARLNMPLGTVKTRLRSGLQHLRQILADQGGPS